MLSVHIDALIFQEWLEFFILSVKVSNSLINTVLSDIFSRENEAISCAELQGDCEVNEVEVVEGPLLVVLNEFIVEVSTGKWVCAILIVVYAHAVIIHTFDLLLRSSIILNEMYSLSMLRTTLGLD